MRMISVMRRRDDLPEMTNALAAVMTAGAAVMTGAAGKLASSDALGLAASLPFLGAAVCIYALVILLWRKVASLMITPITFAGMLLTGSTLFAAATLSLSLLLMSYVYAVSLISRETKFRRIGTLSAAAALCAVLTVTAYAGFRAGSFGEFLALCMDSLSGLLGSAFGLSPEETYVRRSARSILVMTPAYAAALAAAFAWFTELMTKSMFRLLGCPDLFIGITHRITLPLPYAVIYAAAFLLTVMTVPDQYPFFYTLLSSVMIAMMLPCTAVGFSVILRKLRVRMYYASQKRALTSLLLILAAMSMGAVNAAMVLAAAGAYFVIADFFRKQKKRRGNEHRENEKF